MYFRLPPGVHWLFALLRPIKADKVVKTSIKIVVVFILTSELLKVSRSLFEKTSFAKITFS